MVPRIRFVWRVALISIAALLAIQLAAAGAYYVQRNKATAAGFRLPLPDQVAALVMLVDRSPPEQDALALRAVNSGGLRAEIRTEPPTDVDTGWRMVRVETAITGYLDGDRFVSARLLEDVASEEEALARLRSLINSRVRIVVALESGGYMVVETAGELMARLFGLPAGFWAGIAGFVVTVLAVIAIARETRPLSRLAGSVEQFGAALEPATMPARGAPEMRALIGAVNRMQARIATLVKSRTFIIGAISHDLRTHLTRLRLRVETIPEADIRTRMARDIEDMQALTEEALTFAHATFVDPKKQPVDLVALAARECEERAAMGAAVQGNLPAAPVTVAGSAAGLARVIGNLLDNAIKYGTEARVTVAATGDGAELQVEDRGPGIPEAERESIFEPFHRLDPARNQAQGGAGLGLAIVKQIVDSHGGTISVEARDGGGARFRVRLPRAAVA